MCRELIKNRSIMNEKELMNRIKTLEDAMEITGMSLPEVENLPKDVIAYMKLRIIAAALNGLNAETLAEFPKFKWGEWRWFPCFYVFSQEEIESMDESEKALVLARSYGSSNTDGGVAYANAHNDASYSGSDYGSRLALKSRNLAEYAGKQFIEIWADFLMSRG